MNTLPVELYYYIAEFLQGKNLINFIVCTRCFALLKYNYFKTVIVETNYLRNSAEEYILEAVTKDGDLEGLKRLDQGGIITRDHFLIEFSAIYEAASLGYLEILKWIQGRYLFKKEELSKHIFSEAARVGEIKVLQWFKTTFNLSKDDVAIIDGILEHASYGAKLETIKWIYSNFCLTPCDLKRNDYTLKFAIIHGHLDILKWIHSIDLITRSDIKDRRYSSLLIALEHGHFKAVRWLCTVTEVKKGKLPSTRMRPNKHSDLKHIQWIANLF
jgi:hypothetical protein